jgi:hypothetical protein
MTLPSLKLDFIGDRFSGVVVERRIDVRDRNGEQVKTLVISLHLDEPRIQQTAQGPVTALDWNLWLPAGHMQLELHRACRAAGAPVGSPFPGDWIEIEHVGNRPTSRDPKKLVRVSYKAKVQA